MSLPGMVRSRLAAVADLVDHALHARGRVAASRRYTREVVGASRRPDSVPALGRLGIVGGYPVLEYMRLGYDWLGPYYNPLLCFDEVHYFEIGRARERVVDVGYPLHLHPFGDVEDVVLVCRERGVALLRAYDCKNGEIAIEAARRLGVPSVVSVH